MDLAGALEKLLESHIRYYTIERDKVTEPFAAEAVFSFKDTQYLLVRSAKISTQESGEYVFFATPDHLTGELVEELSQKAWAEGTSRVKPHGEHRNTDVILYILTYKMDEDAKQAIKKQKFYQSYRFGLHGFSHFKLIAYDLTANETVFNKMGHDRKKVIDNNFNK